MTLTWLLQIGSIGLTSCKPILEDSPSGSCKVPFLQSNVVLHAIENNLCIFVRHVSPEQLLLSSVAMFSSCHPNIPMGSSRLYVNPWGETRTIRKLGYSQLSHLLLSPLGSFMLLWSETKIAPYSFPGPACVYLRLIPKTPPSTISLAYAWEWGDPKVVDKGSRCWYLGRE